MFIDGVNVASQTATYFTNTDTIHGVSVGCEYTGVPGNIFYGNVTNVRVTPSVLYSGSYTDTCYYTGTYIYAALNDIDSTHIIVNSSPITANVPLLSSTSPCAISTTTEVVDLHHYDVNIYPNPTSDLITINSQGNINSVEIRNSLGQPVFSDNYNSSKIDVDLRQFPSGVYVVRLNDHYYKISKQ
jgi:hypothetical protein